MYEFGCVDIESWKLKFFNEMSKRNMKFLKLKIEMSEYWNV
jgi:hypothetical protein